MKDMPEIVWVSICTQFAVQFQCFLIPCALPVIAARWDDASTRVSVVRLNSIWHLANTRHHSLYLLLNGRRRTWESDHRHPRSGKIIAEQSCSFLMLYKIKKFQILVYKNFQYHLIFGTKTTNFTNCFLIFLNLRYQSFILWHKRSIFSGWRSCEILTFVTFRRAAALSDPMRGAWFEGVHRPERKSRRRR